VNWPLGSGPTFKGVYDRMARQMHLFERTSRGAFEAPVEVLGLDDPALLSRLDGAVHADSLDEIRMLDGGGGARSSTPRPSCRARSPRSSSAAP
jgi:peptide chain release factor 3